MTLEIVARALIDTKHVSLEIRGDGAPSIRAELNAPSNLDETALLDWLAIQLDAVLVDCRRRVLLDEFAAKPPEGEGQDGT